MKNLRQFIYLDEYKIYSLYSQIFKGFTDHVVNYSESKSSESEQQKGPIGSGKFLIDLASERIGQQEKRFLHDYTFTLFEEELEAQQKVLTYDSTASEEYFNTLTPGSIIRVKGPAIFNDVKAICDLLKEFNRLGEAITYVTTYSTRAEIQKIANQSLKEEKDRNTRAKVKATLKNLNNIQILAREHGFHLDEELLKNLKYLFDYGYSEQFELQIYPFEQQSEDPFFSALLKRDCLREDASLLVKKYSRQVQGEFYLLGITCQCPQIESIESTENSEPTELTENSESPNFRKATGNLVSKLKLLEDQFIGRLGNEIILDPLAVYRAI